MKKWNQPCPDCGSSDALAVYEDHTFCFSCKTRKWAEPLQRRNMSELHRSLRERGLASATAAKYNIEIKDKEEGDGWVHRYPFYNKGQVVAHQIRDSDKRFRFSGDISKAELGGQHLFPPNSAKTITVCEGYLDAAAAYQLMGSKYPSVAVYSASSAEKEIRRNFEYLNSFEQIVICFDSDDQGKDAALKCAKVLPIGKVRIVTLSKHKDPCDYLKSGDTSGFVSEWWKGATFTPAGIRLSSSLWDDIETEPVGAEVSYPYQTLQTQTYGLRKSEFIVFHGKTGIGKSTILNEIVYHILKTSSAKVGCLRIEETNRKSALNLLSLEANKPLYLPDVFKATPKEELKALHTSLFGDDRVMFWDHFGSNTSDEVLTTIRFMAAMGAEYIILDHLSIIVSDQSDDERKTLDALCTKLKTLCMECNVAIVAVIHEARSGEIRGTDGVGQLADLVVKLERDLKNESQLVRNRMPLTIMKNRFCGMTGPSSVLDFNPKTSRLEETFSELPVGTESELVGSGH